MYEIVVYPYLFALYVFVGLCYWYKNWIKERRWL